MKTMKNLIEEKIGKMLDKERKCAYYDKVNKYSSGR